MSAITCRELHTIAELQQFVGLEMRVWQMEAADVVPVSMLHALVMTGSLAVGAYDGDKIVGLGLCFPVADQRRPHTLWSHMVGVPPDYQSRGVGLAVKQFQRQWGLARGFRYMSWTFDPLQRGNANFNLHRLGASAQVYHVDFYGHMTDGINAGLPSDRLEVSWLLTSRQADQPDRRKPREIAAGTTQPILVPDCPSGAPRLNLPAAWDESVYYVSIPADILTVKRRSPGLALEWRLALREALLALFEAGYQATDFFQIEPDYGQYVLTAPMPWYLYVLECRDGTLYAGITPDIPKRLKKHNQGQGAAYTASRRPVKLVAAWRFIDRPGAASAEFGFKKLTRDAKLSLIGSRSPFRDQPFVMEQITT